MRPIFPSPAPALDAPLRAHLRHSLLWGTAAVFVLFVMLGAYRSGSLFQLSAISDEALGAVRIFRFLFMQADAWVLAAFVALVVWLMTGPTPLDAGQRQALAWVAAQPAAASAVLALVLAAGARWVYAAHPLSMDEYSPTLQAHIFASGALTGQFEPEQLRQLLNPGFWDYFVAVNPDTGRVASIYSPGHALLMAPFAALGTPWLLNPLLSGAAAYLMVKIATQLTGSTLAGALAFWLAAASAAFTITGISYYALTAHGCFNLLFVHLLLRQQAWSCLAAGVVGGFALILHNPVPHALFAAPWVLWVLWQDRGGRRTWLLLGAYALVALSINLGWRAVVLGVSPSTLLYAAPPADAGWIERLAVVGIELPTPAILEARVIGFAKVWLWSAPGVVVLTLWALRMGWADVRVRLMAASMGLTLLFYFVVRFDQGHGWAYRYFQPAWVLLPILGAMAVHRLGQATARSPGPNGGEATVSNLPAQVWTLVLAGLLLMTPIHVWQTHAFMAWHLNHRIASTGFERSAVFVTLARYPYVADLVQNYPDRPEQRVYMSHGATEDARFMNQHQPAWVCVQRDERGSLWAPVDAAGDTRCPAP